MPIVLGSGAYEEEHPPKQNKKKNYSMIETSNGKQPKTHVLKD
jgi:hypothetical protein